MARIHHIRETVRTVSVAVEVRRYGWSDVLSAYATTRSQTSLPEEMVTTRSATRCFPDGNGGFARLM